MEQFKSLVSSPTNSALISAAFWLALVQVSPVFTERASPEAREFVEEWKSELTRTVADLHLKLMTDISDNFKRLLNKLYFDVVAQGVFYAMFYAFPKSRTTFNKQFKCELFKIMSLLFKGCEVSHKSRFLKNWRFIDDWYLNLGAGNLLADSPEEQPPDPRIVFPKVSNSKSGLKPVRFSPIMENNSQFRAFKMKNVLRPLRMSFTPYFSRIDAINKQSKAANLRFEEAFDFAQSYNTRLKKELYENSLQKDINKIKVETISHCKRLAKKRDEEIEKGSHEYANYIVSMVHSSAVGE